jgi:hypothetical protein
MRRRPSPALVISVIALVVAMTGTGYAAITLPKNSVGTKQLKKNAVTSSKVKNGSLLIRDFKAGQIPSGPHGPQGAQRPQGARGLQGPPGAAGRNGANGATNVVAIDSAGTQVAPGADGFDTVGCDPGQKATGGGVFATDAAGNILNVDTAVTESDTVTLVIEAICASP